MDLNVQLSGKFTRLGTYYFNRRSTFLRTLNLPCITTKLTLDGLKLQEFLGEILTVLKAVLVYQMKNVDSYLANVLVSLHWIFITVGESSPIAGKVNFKIPLLDPILFISPQFLLRNLAGAVMVFGVIQ